MIDPTLALDIVAKVTVVWTVAALASLALPRISAARRHQIWALTLGASIAMPALALVAPRWTVAMLPPSSPASDIRISETPPTTSWPATLPPASADSAAGPSLAGATPLPTHVRQRSFRTFSALALIWAAGALLVLGPFGFGTARLWRMARGARRAPTWAPRADDLAGALGIERPVTFLSGAHDAMPMAWGLVRPHVLLPSDADSWPASRLRVVLLHELAHVKRCDGLTQMIAHMACAIYWFHPMAWLASRRLRTERERACDDLVLAAGTRGSDYADHLLDIARTRRTGTWPTWSAVTMAHRSQLEGRLMAILDPALPRRSPTRTSAGLIAGLILVGVIMLAGVQPVAKAADAALPASPVTPAPVASPAGAAGAQGRPTSPATPTPAPAAPAATRAPVPPAPTPTPTPAPAALVFPQPFVQVYPGVVGKAVTSVAPAQGRGNREADPKVVAALTSALQDEDKQVRTQALHALVSMRAPIAPDVFMNMLKDADPEVRQQAVFALGQLRDEKYLDVLAGALKDDSPQVRQQAAFALGQLRDARAVDPLTALLKDGDAQVRQQAAFALGQLRDRRAIDPLIAALKDLAPEVRRQAAFALGQIR